MLEQFLVWGQVVLAGITLWAVTTGNALFIG
jgi:hypothetical protein